jgi:hypothetical protein
VYNWSQLSVDNHKELLSYLRKSGKKSDAWFFSQWAADRIDLPTEEVQYLLESDNIWIRAYTIHNWPRKCPAASRARLKQELADLKNLLSEPPD